MLKVLCATRVNYTDMWPPVKITLSKCHKLAYLTKLMLLSTFVKMRDITKKKKTLLILQTRYLFIFVCVCAVFIAENTATLYWVAKYVITLVWR